MASYRVEEEDETKELEDEDQQRSIRIVNQNNMNHQRMMTMENDNGSVGIIGSLINMVRKCLLKRRGKNKNDKYEYEVNEYVEDTGYYNEYDVIYGNPPYNVNGKIKVPTNNVKDKKEDGVNMWTKFVRRAHYLLKPNGILLYIIPSIWCKPDKAKIYDLFTDLVILLITSKL